MAAPKKVYHHHTKMAAPKKDLWSVIILDHETMPIGSYKMTPDSRLVEVMNKWRVDSQAIGNWEFTSLDKKTVYDENNTLAMVGETGENTDLMVRWLMVQLSDKPRPTTDVFGYVKDDCHHLKVEPSQKLGEIWQRMPGRPMELEYNGHTLNLEATVDETGVKNYAVITEPSRLSLTNVSVMLSNGKTILFRVPYNSYVLQLMNKVWSFEQKDFSFIYQGRHLHLQESVRNLKHVVKVARVTFKVHMHDRCVTWKTRADIIAFPTFLSQLAINGKLDEKQLETMQFRCSGCERRISNSDATPQLMPIDCCSEKSLTLIATSSSCPKTQCELDSMLNQIENLYKRLGALIAKNGRTDGWRVECREIQEDILKHGLQYNTIVRMCKRLRKVVAELDDKIKSSEVEVQNATDKNTKSAEINQLVEAEEKTKSESMMQTSIQMLNEENQRFIEKIQSLEEKNRRYSVELEEEKKRTAQAILELEEEKKKYLAKKQKFKLERQRSRERIQGLQEERRRNSESFQKLEEEKQLSIEKIQSLEEEKTRTADEIQKLTSLVQETGTSGCSPDHKIHDQNEGVKLLVTYDPDYIRPVLTRPEVKDDKEYASTKFHCIKCLIPEMQAGWNSFEVVREKLKPFFTKNTIRRIGQRRKKTMVFVTSLEDDEVKKNTMQKEFSQDGKTAKWEEAGKPPLIFCKEGDYIYLCKGDRRTILFVDTS